MIAAISGHWAQRGKGGKSMADNDPASSRSLAEQAMSNLVNQFARPMDFLRELVQNSIDAGTPRIDVYLSWVPAEDDTDEGVLQIHVDDHGEGMDEQILDNQLTRLFSSTKENDLTKIGKFGIGFTSIFAIRPDLVHLTTGRHGEYWELVFHPDRTYEKRAHDEPVAGTKITLFKRMDSTQMERTAAEARFILTYWCEHSNVPITFEDKTSPEQPRHRPDPDQADPFSAFMGGTSGTEGPETINRPLGLLGADLQVTHNAGDVSAVAAYVDKPKYGYYNGGLTLISSEHPEVLGEHASTLAHVAFKVQYDMLEHTLTRDNVLQDEHWETAMEVVSDAALRLRAKLLDRIDKAEGKELDRLHRYLAVETQLAGGQAGVAEWWDADRQVFRDHAGEPVTRGRIETQEGKHGVVLLDPGPGPVREAVLRQGYVVLPETAGTRALLFALGRPPIMGLFPAERRLVRADRFFVLPEIVDLLGLPPAERMLVERTQELLDHATNKRMKLHVGDFGGAANAVEEPLALEGAKDATLFERPGVTWRQQLPAWLQWRTLLVNRHHPHYQAQAVAAAENTTLAAFALAQALLMHEEIEGNDAFDLLMEAARS